LVLGRILKQPLRMMKDLRPVEFSYQTITIVEQSSAISRSSLQRQFNLCMKPTINDLNTWNQAERLLQPAFIRLIDNFRKASESTDWEVRYEDLQTWPAKTTEAQKARWAELSAMLETTQPLDLAAVEAELASLPTPELFYRLNLERDTQQVQFDLWQLCYQACFRSYVPGLPSDAGREAQAVEIDDRLLDAQGEVDWVALDKKAQGIVEQIMQSLP